MTLMINKTRLLYLGVNIVRMVSPRRVREDTKPILRAIYRMLLNNEPKRVEFRHRGKWHKKKPSVDILSVKDLGERFSTISIVRSLFKKRYAMSSFSVGIEKPYDILYVIVTKDAFLEEDIVIESGDDLIHLSDIIKSYSALVLIPIQEIYRIPSKRLIDSLGIEAYVMNLDVKNLAYWPFLYLKSL